MTSRMYQYEVGQPCPGAVPGHDGAVFEIGRDGSLHLMIQVSGMSGNELTAMKAGFSSYSLFEAFGIVGIAVWCFCYSAPFGIMDAPFHAGLYRDDRAVKLLSSANNLLTVIALDGQIIKNIRAVGLQPDSMDQFRVIVERQIETPLTTGNYASGLREVMAITPGEIYRRGVKYKNKVVEI